MFRQCVSNSLTLGAKRKKEMLYTHTKRPQLQFDTKHTQAQTHVKIQFKDTSFGLQRCYHYVGGRTCGSPAATNDQK